MNGAAWSLLTAAAALAVVDWIAVSPRVSSQPVEYLCKPAVLAALIGVALVLDPQDGAERALFTVALALSLAGDVFLMLPANLFVAGLASFLAGHLAYVAGFALSPRSGVAVTAATAAVVVLASTVGARIVRAVRSGPEPAMAVPVAIYMLVISSMVVMAASTAEVLAAAGAGLFFLSDSLIAWDRFLRPFAWARPAIMVTYHLAQAGLVLSLVR